MAEGVIDLTDVTFDEIVNSSDVPVLVDFWAPWCGPCKMIAPVLSEIAQELGDKAVIAKIDIDDHNGTAMEYQVQSIPTILLFKNGQLEKKWVGLTSKKDLLDAINEAG